MSWQYQPSWEEPHYYNNNAITEDGPTYMYEVPASDIDSLLTGKANGTHAFNSMTNFLTEEKPYFQMSAQEYSMGTTAPWPVTTHDPPRDPSSPEGSEGSDLSSILDNDKFMATPLSHTQVLSRNSSVFSSEPAGFSRANSRSSTFMDSQMLAPAFQGSSMPYYQTSSLAEIQGSQDIDLFKTEDAQCDDANVNMDFNLKGLLSLTQHYTGYQSYNENITCHGSTAPTHNANIKSEGEAEYEDSEPEYPAEDDESDTDYRPSGARRSSTRRTMPRRRTVSDAPKPSRITKPKVTPRRTSMDLVITAQRSGENKHPCVFSFAGCNSTWKTKNEWKRHAMTQHIVLESYHCKLCKDNGDGNSNGLGNGKGRKGKMGKMGMNIAWANVGGVDGQIFNRKDLFTQHVKRMHEPTAYRQCSKGGGTAVQKKEYEDWIKRQQQVAHFHTGRQALNISACPMMGCNSTFQGGKGWDDRLEHIWKHFERKECDAMTDMGEGGLKEWALASGVVVEDADGRSVLKECTTDGKTCSEEDAEGDFEE